ncbi:unnamed protein product [Tuber aestivum]|uniref:Uncharacterized protein n=1 Tax=Tuber aestivum TaxID=59557 RepID=A0A292PXA8_9PEZI|nr:unnamed protein product [Tuber aestivum]
MYTSGVASMKYDIINIVMGNIIGGSGVAGDPGWWGTTRQGRREKRGGGWGMVGTGRKSRWEWIMKREVIVFSGVFYEGDFAGEMGLFAAHGSAGFAGPHWKEKSYEDWTGILLFLAKSRAIALKESERDCLVIGGGSADRIFSFYEMPSQASTNLESWWELQLVSGLMKSIEFHIAGDHSYRLPGGERPDTPTVKARFRATVPAHSASSSAW